MLDPTSLFQFESHVDQRTIRARALVVTLGSYADAGHTQHIVDEHLLNTLDSHQIGHVDIDQVLDYAGHRPSVVFDGDRFTGYDAPSITLHQLTDDAGEPFLLLRGPEPALQWERMAAAVQHIVEQLDVQTTYLVAGFPAPMPHTRPLEVTRFASDPAALLPGNQRFPARFQMSASFGGLLTIRLGEAGHDVIGLMVHVPQYLADVEYPDAAIAALTNLSDVGSLQLPTGQLAASAGIVRAQIDAQMSDSEELTQVVGQLEANYDEFMRGRRSLPAPEVAEGSIPSADEIGAQFEEYLQTLDDLDSPDQGDEPGEGRDGGAGSEGPGPEDLGPDDPR